MGTEFNLGDHSYIDLSQEFVNKYLSEYLFLIPYNYNPKPLTFSKPIVTTVRCCKCNTGFLRLIDKRKDICEVHVCHNGDSYTFQCSECKTLYYYRNQWLFC